MLRHLRVTNFAILSDVEIELGPGMNVLTGETGAGKSLIVEAVNLLRGGGASADIPPAGGEELLYGGDGDRECTGGRYRVGAAGREVERAMRTDPTFEPVVRQLGEIEN